jgi:PhnB protein
MGHKLNQGNTLYISLHPDSREEADRLFKGLSEGGTVEMPMEDQFWGDYFGSFVDKFGIGWMVNYNPMNQ